MVEGLDTHIDGPVGRIVGTIAGVVVLAAFVSAGVELRELGSKPESFYLNWLPGTYSVAAFFSGTMMVMLGTAAAAISVAMGVVKRSAMALIVGTAFSGLILSNHDGAITRGLAQTLGVAQSECWNPGTFECRLNELHRQYDTGRQSAAASDTIAEYAALRRELPEPGPMSQAHVYALARWSHQNADALMKLIPLPTCSPLWDDTVPRAQNCQHRL